MTKKIVMPYLLNLSFLKIPKVQLALALILIYLSSLKQYSILSSLSLVIYSLGFTIIFDLLFTFLKSKTFFLPLSALITGLIIALIIDPNAAWYQVAIICALSMGFKNFVRFEGRHIFNPAAIGLFLGGVIFNLGVSWWGASFQIIQTNFWPFLILLTPAFVSFYRMRRFGSILSFLLTYNILSSFKLIFDPTTIFFSLVMLPEPMTSPFNLKRQILYGAAIAVAVFALSFVPITLPDILIPALLFGNMLFFKFK